MSYIKRSLEPVAVRAAAEFPAVVLVGPRQAGKTTLLRQVFADAHRYVSLEPPDVRAAAAHDPRGFLAQWPAPVLLDEIQCVPELLPYIKEAIDSRRSAKGQFILTGSQNLLLMKSVSETLAGRAAILRLLPLSCREVAHDAARSLPWMRSPDAATATAGSLRWDDLLRGSYPEVVSEPGRDVYAWYQSYVQTYLERDVRSLRQVGDLVTFQSFLRSLAARSAQLLNLSDLSRDIGVAVNTAKAWLSLLEASFQVIVLRPYHASLGKRLVKTPKVYFTDTGTLCHLTGLTEAGHAAAGPMAGALFETAVLGELLKAAWHAGRGPRIYFWRTSAGQEVDFVLEHEGRLIPIEAKLSSTPNARMAEGIQAFRQLFGKRAASGYVVHPGTVTAPLGHGDLALPLSLL